MPPILVTGHYWHRDFKRFLAGFDQVTLMPIEKISGDIEDQFELIVVTQSRPGQYSLQTIEKLQAIFPNRPLVSVSGSWCEGELRTGKPWPGVQRILWHQWQGQYDRFLEQLGSKQITDFHAPRTSTHADQILRTHDPHAWASAPHPHSNAAANVSQIVGVSTWTQRQYDMLRDAIETLGFTPFWIECPVSDASQRSDAGRICVDADSLTPELNLRLDRLQSEFPLAKMMLLLNFPRIEDRMKLAARDIQQVVSKPFELNELKLALDRLKCRDEYSQL